jgi:NAD(P)-dependent dehydrogenase (short-subunit alcohol dehydrogenase family)
MPPWTTDDIPDLSGRTAVVTGANSGLGFESALALGRAGAEVVLACRDQVKGTGALDRIRLSAPDAKVSLAPLDLADLGSVAAFASAYADQHDGLDILLNNAGVMAIPRRETADGFEMQFGTNHLGHFALTAHLLDSLLARPGARVVTVSSAVAQIGRIRFDDLQGTGKYGKWSAYAQAKLANQLFILELDRRATRAHAALIAVAAHPGYAATNLQSVGPQMSGSGITERLTGLANSIFGQSAAGGALPSLYGATAPGVSGGQYFGPGGFMAQRGAPKEVSFVKAAEDRATARRLWEVSEELTGVTFGALDAEG